MLRMCARECWNGSGAAERTGEMQGEAVWLVASSARTCTTPATSMNCNLHCLTTPARAARASLKKLLAPVLLRHPDVDLVLVLLLVVATKGALQACYVPVLESFKKRLLKQPLPPLAEPVAVQPHIAELIRGIWLTLHGKWLRSSSSSKLEWRNAANLEPEW